MTNDPVSPSRFGTKFYTSTTRSEFQRKSVARPSSANLTTTLGGRCGPGRDLPNHYLSTQRQFYQRPQSASSTTTSFAGRSVTTQSNNNNNNSDMSSAFLTISSLNKKDSAISCSTARLYGRRAGADDPRESWKLQRGSLQSTTNSNSSRPASASTMMMSNARMNNNNSATATTTANSSRNFNCTAAEFYGQSRHAPHIHMTSGGSWSMKLRK